MTKIKVVASLLLLSLLSSTSFAHSGGTNSDGCHNDNVNGGYHCHNDEEEESLSNGSIAAIVILSVGLTVWYYYDKSSHQNNIDFAKTKSAHDNLSFSLLPTSPDSLDGIMLNASYAF